MSKQAVRATIVAVLVAACGAIGAAQIPTEFKNLQVLPKTISRPELIQTMRGITTDLGVRCATCHVGPDNLQGMDFSSDEKPAKQAARTMLAMVQRINADFVSAIPRGSEARQVVTCGTCHRGSAIPPRPLAALLLQTVASGGVDAAIAEHGRLRQELGDAGLYDFRERTLNQVGTRLREQNQLAEALAIFVRNAELFPGSAAALVAVGDTALLLKNSSLAEESYKKALAIAPQHPGALRGLASIKR